MSKKLSSSMEDYLETIYVLSKENGHVRVKDISNALNKTMPSVSGAVKKMEQQGLVCHPRYDLVGLTDSGLGKAQAIYKRHNLIREFLEEVLGLDAESAETDACCIEHVVSEATLAGFSRLLDEMKSQPKAEETSA